MSAAVARRVDMSTTGQLLMDFAVDCFLENVSTKELSALLGAITSIANESLVSEDEVEFWMINDGGGGGGDENEIISSSTSTGK